MRDILLFPCDTYFTLKTEKQKHQLISKRLLSPFCKFLSAYDIFVPLKPPQILEGIHQS